MSTTSRHLLEFVGIIAVVYCIIFLAMYYDAHAICQSSPHTHEVEKESGKESSSIPSALVEYYETKPTIYYHF